MRFLLTSHREPSRSVTRERAAEILRAGHDARILEGGVEPEFALGECESSLAAQLVELRQRLDAAVLEFDPHVIYADQAWLFARVALESGVPYVLSPSRADLDRAMTGGPGANYVLETLENAWRVIACASDHDAILRLVGDLDGRIVLLETNPDEMPPGPFAAILESALAERQAAWN